MIRKENVDKEFTDYYCNLNYSKIYPTEFVVRTFLGSSQNYPDLLFEKPKKNDKVIDISCGYGKNLLFLCEQGYDAVGTEVTQEICDSTKQQLRKFGHSPEILAGKNNNLPFEDGFADYLLAIACIYYCDAGTSIKDNIREYARILKPGGYLVASVVHKDSEHLNGAKVQDNGTFLISNNPGGNNHLIGYTLYAAESTEQLIYDFSPEFSCFSFGEEKFNCFGNRRHFYWIVCKKAL